MSDELTPTAYDEALADPRPVRLELTVGEVTALTSLTSAAGDAGLVKVCENVCGEKWRLTMLRAMLKIASASAPYTSNPDDWKLRVGAWNAEYDQQQKDAA